MMTNTKTGKQKTHETAQEALERNLAVAMTQVNYLGRLLEAERRTHGTHWGHVGNVAHVSQRLIDLVDFLMGNNK